MQIIKSEFRIDKIDADVCDKTIDYASREIAKELLKNNCININKHIHKYIDVTLYLYSMSKKEYERAKEIISGMKTNKTNINALINELENIFKNNYTTPSN